MMIPPASRRRMLGGLIVSAFAPIPGLFGSRAKAAQSGAHDLKVIEQAAAPLKPVTTYLYCAIVRSNDGEIVAFSSITTSESYARTFLSHYCEGSAKNGDAIEIQRMPSGGWETMDYRIHREVLPRGRRLSDATREDAEDYRRMDSCPNDTLRHPWHNWREPKAPNPGPDNDPLRGVIPAGD